MHLYIHIPFCTQRCKYCDFVAFSNTEFQEEYVTLLLKEIELLSKRYECNLKTLYLGGGTPSLLSIENLNRIYDAVEQNFSRPSQELTIEFNPEDCSYEKLSALKQLGFDRISLGVQSFEGRILDLIGRNGSKESSINAYQNIIKAGFSNISLDLIYGIPTQKMIELEHTIDQMIELAPTHISTYSLMINKGTMFYSEYQKNKFKLLDDDTIADQFDYIVDRLGVHGYKRYEIANFARDGYQSIHNRAYWNMAQTLGAGIGAVYTRRGFRYENTYSYNNYKKMLEFGELPLVNIRELSIDDEISERIMMGFRLSDGINFLKLNKEFSIDFLEKYSKQIEKYTTLGYMQIDTGHIFLNNSGMNISNSIICDFIL